MGGVQERADGGINLQCIGHRGRNEVWGYPALFSSEIGKYHNPTYGRKKAEREKRSGSTDSGRCFHSSFIPYYLKRTVDKIQKNT